MTSEHKILRPHVLLVDDEPEWGDALGEQLGRRGFEVHVSDPAKLVPAGPEPAP